MKTQSVAYRKAYDFRHIEANKFPAREKKRRLIHIGFRKYGKPGVQPLNNPGRLDCEIM